jgi:hypothetical protein
VEVTNTTKTAKQLTAGSAGTASFGTVVFLGGAEQSLKISQSFTCETITFTAPMAKVVVTKGIVITATHFIANGSEGSKIVIESTEAGKTWELKVAEGVGLWSVNGVSFKDTVVSAPNKLYAAKGSVNVSGNTNIAFATPSQGFLVGQAQAITMVKQPGRKLALTTEQAQAIGLAEAQQRKLSVSQPQAPSFTAMVATAFSLTASNSTSVSWKASLRLSLSVSQGSAITVAHPSQAHSLMATAGQSSSMADLSAHALTGETMGAASVQRFQTHAFSIAQVQSATARLFLPVALTAPGAQSANAHALPARILSSTGMPEAELERGGAKVTKQALTASVSSSATTARKLALTLSLSCPGTVLVTSGPSRTLSSTVTQVVSWKMLSSKSPLASSGQSATLGKAQARAFSIAQAQAPTVGRRLARTLTESSTQAVEVHAVLPELALPVLVLTSSVESSVMTSSVQAPDLTSTVTR